MADRGPFYILTDAEVRQLAEKERRDQLLARLQEASSKKSKIVKSKAKEPEEKTGKEVMDSVFKRSYAEEQPPVLSDAQFDQLTQDFTPDINPLEESTGENILGYYSPNDSGDHRFANLYKSEIAMMSQILKRVNEQSTLVNQRIRGMSKGKGAVGVGKSYSDLIMAANSLHSTSIQAIKGIADLKKTQVELTLKDEKEHKDTALTVDETADNFYNMIIGNRKQFIERSTGGGQMPYTGNDSSEDGASSSGTAAYYDDSQSMEPIPSYSIGDYKNPNAQAQVQDQDSGVSSYIRYENRNVDVCVLHYPDDTYRFAAIADDGLEVEDYEVPGDDLLESLIVQPMAKYAYDKTGRKFRIIDVNTDGVDLSDVDDDDYEYTDPNDVR